MKPDNRNIEQTRDDLPPLDNVTTWRGVDSDFTAVEIAPDALPGFHKLTVANNGELPRKPLRVARWGLSANLDLMGVGVVSRWSKEVSSSKRSVSMSSGRQC